MRKLLCALLLLCGSAAGANTKLYLKDGSFHVVREYKVDGSRVKFYSIERSEWEEMPVELIDLPRTQSEKKDRDATLAEQAKALSEEDKAVRAQQDEVLKIPQDPGVYSLDEGAKLRIFKAAESKIHNNKGRSIIKAMSPVPLIPGKATVEVDQAHSLNILATNRPELYIQLSAEQRFGIVKVTPHQGVRIVEHLSIIPVTKEVMEQMDQVEIFRKQLTEGGLYKIWPQNALEPGEYAVVEYTEGKVNTQIWDFAVK